MLNDFLSAVVLAVISFPFFRILLYKVDIPLMLYPLQVEQIRLSFGWFFLKGNGAILTSATAMMKKYEVSMSIEWMFAVAMIGVYSPAFQKAYADRKAMKAEKEKLRRQEELEILAKNIKG